MQTIVFEVLLEMPHKEGLNQIDLGNASNPHFEKLITLTDYLEILCKETCLTWFNSVSPKLTCSLMCIFSNTPFNILVVVGGKAALSYPSSYSNECPDKRKL